MTTVTAPVIYLLMAIAPDGTALMPEAGNPPMFMTQKSCLEACAESTPGRLASFTKLGRL